jgi:hypothetical protein
MNPVRWAIGGLIGLGLLAGMTSNFLAFGDVSPTTMPSTQPATAVATPTTLPTLTGGPVISNKYAAPSVTPVHAAELGAVPGKTGPDSDVPSATIQVGVGLGHGAGQQVNGPATPLKTLTPTTSPSSPISR